MPKDLSIAALMADSGVGFGTSGARGLAEAMTDRVCYAYAAAFLAHLIMCGLLLVFGLLCRFRVAYLVGWMLIVGCIVLEHWIARRRSLKWIDVAFFRLNAVISAVFLIVVLAEVVFRGGFWLRWAAPIS